MIKIVNFYLDLNRILESVLKVSFSVLVPMDLARNNAYPTPFANNPILPLLLLSLARQRHSPKVSTTIREEYDYIIGNVLTIINI